MGPWRAILTGCNSLILSTILKDFGQSDKRREILVDDMKPSLFTKAFTIVEENLDSDDLRYSRMKGLNNISQNIFTMVEEIFGL